ncbi:MAG: phenylacetic acid degradation operon negative regulatory protein [Parcubacteria group bacterium Gr01-1014_2]|nr:MAG: phenylacetic acid degradation operon negative regulatory protein [Parcubacteria group bacterium Gr01-1014_2]
MKFGQLKVREKSFVSKVLKGMAITGAVLVAASNKRFWFNFYLNHSKEFNKYKNQKEKQKLYNALQYLKQKKLVDITEKPNGILVKITTKGYEIIEFYESLEKIKIKKPQKWDRKFRLVIFDIPAKKQGARAALLQKLKEMGFYMLQESIWVHPYDCINEIATLRKLFEIEPYVKIMTTQAIEEEYKLLKHFELLS